MLERCQLLGINGTWRERQAVWDCAAELHGRRAGIDKQMMMAVASFADSRQAVAVGTQPGLRMHAWFLPGLESACVVIQSVDTSALTRRGDDRQSWHGRAV